MRQTHVAGEKLFVDYAGRLADLRCGTGEITPAQIFVAVLGVELHLRLPPRARR